MENIIKGNLIRDNFNNPLVDNGFVTCTCEDGLQFQINASSIDFSCDVVETQIDGKIIHVQLHTESDTANTVNPEPQNHIPPEISPAPTTSMTASNSKDRTFSWTDASTKLFLTLYKEKKELVSQRKIKTAKLMWKHISEEMAKAGYVVTADQAENKFKTLDRAYKNMVSSNKKTGRGRTTCNFESELTEILGHKHNITPLVVSGRNGLVFQDPDRNQNESSNVSVNNEESQNLPSLPLPSTSAQVDRQTPSTSSSSSSGSRPSQTSRALELCQISIEKMTEEIINQRKSREELQRQILEEHKSIREGQERLIASIEANRIVVNQQRAEKINLLKELITLMSHHR